MTRKGRSTSLPHGANMAFRRVMFDKYGGFRADLGRCGESLIGNEDTEFAGRLMAAGERLCYVPSAMVNHPVHQDRVKKGVFPFVLLCSRPVHGSPSGAKAFALEDPLILPRGN